MRYNDDHFKTVLETDKDVFIFKLRRKTMAHASAFYDIDFCVFKTL
jgi:hypothetical protein